MAEEVRTPRGLLALHPETGLLERVCLPEEVEGDVAEHGHVLRCVVLARRAGVGTAFLYQLESGKPTVRMDKVLAVLEALELCFTVEESGGDKTIRTRLTPWD